MTPSRISGKPCGFLDNLYWTLWAYRTKNFYNLLPNTKAIQTGWWLELAENNEARKRMYNELSEARMNLGARICTAIRRALTDVRAYHFDPDRAALLASEKKRIMTSTVNLGLNVIERTEFADIAVETDVNDMY